MKLGPLTEQEAAKWRHEREWRVAHGRCVLAEYIEGERARRFPGDCSVVFVSAPPRPGPALRVQAAINRVRRWWRRNADREAPFWSVVAVIIATAFVVFFVILP